MKKRLILCSLWLCLVPALFAGTTTVSGTITDPNGQAFANGNVTATFRPSPDRPTDTYTSGGATFSQTITATLNGSGAFAGMILTDSLTVSPGNSSWIFTVCSNTSAPCFQYTAPNGSITGGALSLTGPLTAAAPVIKIQPNVNIMQFAYVDSEINGPIIGSVYYNTLTGNARVFNGTIWANIATSTTSCATINNLCKSDGAGGFVNSALVDNATLIVSSESLQVPDSSSVNGIRNASNTGWAFSGNNIWGIAGGTRRVGFASSTDFTMSSSMQLGWSSNTDPGLAGSDTFIARHAPRVVRIGAAASAGPTADILQIGEDGVGANVAGSNGTLRCGNGTGTGGGGSCIFQTGVAHGSDSTLDTFTTFLSADKTQAVTIPVSVSSPHVIATTDLKVASSQALTGVQGTTGTNVFSCTGAFVSGNFVKTDANGNCIDGGSTVGAATKEISVVTAATQSGTVTTTYFLNGTSIAAAEWVAGARFVFEGLSKWQNNDSGLSKTATSGIGIDGTQRTTCSHGSAIVGATQFAFDRMTLVVITTGAGGTVLITNECISSTGASSNETTTTTTVAMDTTVAHTISAAINVPSVDTSSTGTNIYLLGHRIF